MRCDKNQQQKLIFSKTNKVMLRNEWLDGILFIASMVFCFYTKIPPNGYDGYWRAVIMQWGLPQLFSVSKTLHHHIWAH